MIFRKSDVILIFILIISALYCYAFFGGYLGLSDGNDYAGLARNILRGEGFSLGHLYPLALTFNSDIPQPNNLWAPVYPVYLAGWFALFAMSDSVILVAIIFSIWLLILAAYFLAKKLIGANWALLVAGLVGLNQSLLSTALEGSPEPLTAALFLFSVYPLFRQKSRANVIISAALFGLVVLSRYQMIIMSIPILYFLLGGNLKKVTLWVAVILLTLSPWLIRNIITFGNPIFTLQSYGEFTKGMGHLDYYYYTYRSFTPMSFIYALFHFPYYVFKKFAAGIVFFSWWTIVVLNYFGILPLSMSLTGKSRLGEDQRRFIKFGVWSVILLIVLSSFDGIHLRHLINIQGIFAIALVMGIVVLRDRFRMFNNKYILTGAIILLLLPWRFPFLEMEHSKNVDRIGKNKIAYSAIAEETESDDVIVSDASDAVWWYCDRLSIWIPVKYDDFRKLLDMRKIDYIYFEEGSRYLEDLTEDELIDFFRITSLVDGTAFGWSLYKIN